ncbi:hypothetical protein FHR99_001798 [Litorivivens lipolytica]|uniref:Pyridoxamine 5'-phosphate oxidase n=1 Tax=Litorivivens lipolytica TaxID=1524264 RepID=A0A7W4W644_9GAMM|nr:hypothetical protein [Litorivivens lipolytica]MBB3047532.1 hypothetical protein [Litorivivens lipolytica]
MTASTKLKVSEKSQLDAEAITAYLHEALVPLRLAVVGSDGCPLVASHWFEFRHQKIYCVLHEDALVAKRLQATGCCGFEVAHESMPYRGVRGQADVALLDGDAVAQLRQLFARYGIREQSKLAQWLLGRGDEERLVCLTPRWITGWDYSQRMSDAR